MVLAKDVETLCVFLFLHELCPISRLDHQFENVFLSIEYLSNHHLIIVDVHETYFWFVIVLPLTSLMLLFSFPSLDMILLEQTELVAKKEEKH
jgi:hypothetical protein